jgi:hypothetical protein
MYSISQDETATTHHLRDRTSTHQAIMKEEHCVGGAQPGVDVAGEVAAIVAQQPCCSSPLPVAQTALQRPDDVAKDSFHSLEMLLSWSLEKMAHIPDGICQVRPGVDKVPHAANDALILTRVHFLHLAIMADSKPRVH